MRSCTDTDIDPHFFMNAKLDSACNLVQFSNFFHLVIIKLSRRSLCIQILVLSMTTSFMDFLNLQIHAFQRDERASRGIL